MKGWPRGTKNAILALVSVSTILVLSVVADRVAGRLLSTGPASAVVELMYPPGLTSSFETIEFTYTVHINALGLRDREFAVARSQTYRVLAIGDSLTYGWGVEIEQTWPTQLERNLREGGLDLEVLNLGRSGIAPSFYALLAERAIPLLKPDLVIVAVSQCDDVTVLNWRVYFRSTIHRLYPNLTRLWRGPAPTRSPLRKASAEQTRRATAQRARSHLDEATDEQKARFHRLEPVVKDAFLRGELNAYKIRIGMRHPERYMAALDLTSSQVKTGSRFLAAYLGRIKHVADAHDAKVMVLTVPAGPYVNTHAFRGVQRIGYDMAAEALTSDAPDRAIFTACGKAGIRCFAVTDAFRERQDDPTLYYELDGHFTAAAHAFYGDLVTPIVMKQIRSAGSNAISPSGQGR